MIADYSPGDGVEWCDRVYDCVNRIGNSGKWLPAIVVGVHHELDEQGTYTRLDLLLYSGRRRTCHEPEIRVFVRPLNSGSRWCMHGNPFHLVEGTASDGCRRPS